ncbi:type 1 glutamine amidotransferase domain-containing protein [Methylocella sp.]|uniref:type 1 glutamine amidotransferase domain-containing protein n=1 Tax=Methylocella sp. TaxID=1978226 RepID=UPI00378461E2
MTDVQNAKILIVATDGVEQSELLVPRRKLAEAGAAVTLAAPHGPRIRGWNETDWGEEIEVDALLDEVSAGGFHVLVLPGGVLNPDRLRLDPRVIGLVKDFLAAGKIVAAICHAPWLLIEAGVVEGRELTSVPAIRADVVNAGGLWVDRPAVVTGGMITSRTPDDLDAFVTAIVAEVEGQALLAGEPFRRSA